jgi:hypothetical protein
MNQPRQLRPDLQEAVADILALRAMARNDHFLTHKAQRDILGKLNAQDLALVARALAAAEAKQQPICIRKPEVR